MAHPRLTVRRTLLTTGATLAALVVPLGSAAFAQNLETYRLDADLDDVKSSLEAEGDEEEEGLADAVEGAVTELLGDAPAGGADGAAPSDGGREMGPAGGGEMTPVEEPGATSQPASQPAPQAASAPPPGQPAESQASRGGGYAAGPRLQQWFSRSAPTLDHFAGPLVAAPLVVPAPSYAEAATVAGLGTPASDGWAMTSTPLHSTMHLNPYTPTEWPLAVAAGMLMLVAGAHVLRLYDRRWKASVVQVPGGPYVTSTE